MSVQSYITALKNQGFTLNQPQHEAVLHKDGPLMVIAGPGSGKTRVITARVGALLAAGVNPAEIMVVTFTRAAAAEMKSRISNQIGRASCRERV